VANHNPRNKTHLPEINIPPARISGVDISMCYSIDSNTCIEVTTCMAMGRLVPLTPAGRFKNNFVLGHHCTGLYMVDGISLGVPSAEHPPSWGHITQW
jgi:hypothetical protein